MKYAVGQIQVMYVLFILLKESWDTPFCGASYLARMWPGYSGHWIKATPLVISYDWLIVNNEQIRTTWSVLYKRVAYMFLVVAMFVISDVLTKLHAEFCLWYLRLYPHSKFHWFIQLFFSYGHKIDSNI